MISETRVLHIVPAPFEGPDRLVGGAERYAHELARHMSGVCPTTLLSFGNHESEIIEGQFRRRTIGSAHFVRGQRTNPVAWAMLAEIARANVVHCHQYHVVASSAAAAYARLRRTPVFVSDLGGGGWDISAYISTKSWFTGHLHISDYSRRIAGDMGNPTAHVIYGGVDTRSFLPPSAEVTRSGVLFVGRLMPHKGVDLLIEAMPSDVPLQVIGRSFDTSFLEHLHRLAHNKSVSFQHDCDDATLIRAYQGAACVVLPSVYESARSRRTVVPELLGQTLLEGMACGAPVICTDVASMPEVVAHGKCGLVVPPNDLAALRAAIVSVATDTERIRTFGEAGRERVLAQFTWDQVVQRCLKAYGV